MNKIEVAVLDNHSHPGAIMVALARLTQRGHKISTMDDLKNMFDEARNARPELMKGIAKLPHGTIKRFCPITVAIVGASRRFLAQARTHQVGFNYVSASLQYSDYSGKAQFVVPYALLEKDEYIKKNGEPYLMTPSQYYLESCSKSMEAYSELAEATDNDTAGYAAPQGLRNILIMQANHEAWMNFIRARGCNRNTVETQYVTLRIWEELLDTPDGPEMFSMAGPDCVYGSCREGKMCCREPLRNFRFEQNDSTLPRRIIDAKWPLLKEL